MKIQKISLVAVLAMAGLLASSVALRAEDKPEGGGDAPKHQRPGGPGGPGGRGMGAKMEEELGLTDAQKEQMKAAREEVMQKQKAIHEDASLTDEQKKEKSKALREEHKAKVKTILTAEQFAKWEKAMAQRDPGGPRGPKGPPKGEGEGHHDGPPPGDKPAKQQ